MAPSRKSKIYFFFERQISLGNRTELKRFLENIFKQEGKSLNYLNYIFCSDDYLRAINKTYLNHNYYTDIITFELSAKGGPVEGEVYISVDRVKENSLSFEVSFRKEVHRIIIHGALHLCGYGDKTKPGKREMTKREDFYLARYFNCST